MKYLNFGAKIQTLPECGKRKRIISVKECEVDLKDVLPLLFTAFHRTVPRYMKEVAQTSPINRVRGFEAIIFNSKLAECLREIFGDSLKRGKFGRILLYKNGYVILFKKLDKKGQPMYIRTKSAVSIANQLQGNLFNKEDDGTSPIVIFGYTMNDFGEITRPKLVYIDEEKVKWCIDETQLGLKVEAQMELFPPQSSSQIAIKPHAKLAKKKET